MAEDDVFEGDEGTTHSSLEGDDLASLSSLGSTLTNEQRKQKLKRAVAQVQRLKQEVAMLRDALESARMNDVTLIEDRYRGSQADLANVRKRNGELKDRVQVLEKNLFDALAENRELKNGEKEGFGDAQDDGGFVKGKTKKFSNLDAYGDDQTMKINALRRSHDMKTSEYVAKIAVLQGRIDQLEATAAISDGTIPSNGIPIIAPRFTGLSGLDDEMFKSMSVKLPKLDKKKLEGYVVGLVEEKQKTDRKTIDGLIQEVDRLTALLPEPEPEDEDGEATSGLEDDKEEDEEEVAVEPVEQRRSVGLVQSRYNFMHIFLGFVFGSAVATSWWWMKAGAAKEALDALTEYVQEAMKGKDDVAAAATDDSGEILGREM